ncbi:S8 family peptidase [Lacrimispora sp. JR3]|uniref:S8 family peptidase n=1 Tax=Lacrimispora sinapis TaxID=3111456 RepID=UPI00374814D0
MEKILDENYYDLIIENIVSSTYNTGENVTPLNETYSILHVRTAEINTCDQTQSPYSYFPEIYTLVSQVSEGIAYSDAILINSQYDFHGNGILAGIIGTGINYQHPAFINRNGTTCIASIWDQTVQGGTIPPGFTFGSEYTSDRINQALDSSDPLQIVPSVDTNGHGTAVASVIAGRRDFTRNFSGIVPESELVIVKLKEAKQNLRQLYNIPDGSVCFQETDVMLGLRYLVNMSLRLKRPLVLCIALGSSQGGHDGINPVSDYLDNISRLLNMGICAAAGDEGDKGRHYFNSTYSEPFVNEFQMNVGRNDKLFSMEIWPYAPSSLSIEIISPLGETTQAVLPSLECKEFVFEQSQSVVLVHNFIFRSRRRNPLILISFRNAYPGVWSFRVVDVEDTPFSFHTWLPSDDLISNETYFYESNPDTTITSPGNTINILTVTAYDPVTNSILVESGRGYTRTGGIKPDIAAAGSLIPCAISGSGYGVLNGTGAAVCFAAGAIAMIMEWVIRTNNAALNGNQLHGMLIQSAWRDPSRYYPDNVWGYGILDIRALLRMLSDQSRL